MFDRDKEGAAALSRKAVQWGRKTALGSSSNKEVKKDCVSCTCKMLVSCFPRTKHCTQNQSTEQPCKKTADMGDGQAKIDTGPQSEVIS